MSKIHPDATATDRLDATATNGPDARHDAAAPPSSLNPAVPGGVHPSKPRDRPSGPSVRRAVILLGLLLGGSRLATGVGDPAATAASMIRSGIDAAAIALAGSIAARATELVGRTIADTLDTRNDRETRIDTARLERADRAIAAIERLAVSFETRGIPGPPTPAEDRSDRTRLIAELAAALRETRLDEAEAMLDRLEAEFPDEPARQDLREQLEAARRRQSEERIAQIDAARRVNDADRVLELYALAGPSLEFERRGEIERDLARWFLDLIHRRLRIGKIQPEVVGLAARAAEVFGATVEGASLRASLPVLRRSVGLCPRCARPYVGPEAACPHCLAGVPPDAVLPPASTVPAPHAEPDLAEPHE